MADQENAERELAAAQRRFDQAERRHGRADDRTRRAMAQRDDAIRAAVEADLRRARIITITQLSYQRINQIVRGSEYLREHREDMRARRAG